MAKIVSGTKLASSIAGNAARKGNNNDEAKANSPAPATTPFHSE